MVWQAWFEDELKVFAELAYDERAKAALRWVSMDWETADLVVGSRGVDAAEDVAHTVAWAFLGLDERVVECRADFGFG